MKPTRLILLLVILLTNPSANFFAQNSSGNSNNHKELSEIIEFYKSDALANGHTIIGSGIYNEIETLIFNVSPGETYVIAAAIDGTSRFGIDLYSYSDMFLMEPTNKWNDTKYQMKSTDLYALKTTTFSSGNQSILNINFGLTKSSSINRIYFSPFKNLGVPIYWVMFKVK